ncbi:cutinase [Mycena leptocephala]|nr:cutinase [Mycena leptocephala]
MRSLLGDLPAEVSALVELAELTGLDESDSSGGDSGGGCSDVTVIFARGTTEDPPIGSRVGIPFQLALENFLVSMNKTLTFSGVDYPAEFVGFFEGGSPEGSVAMAQQLTSAANSCPNTWLVSAGYSQGGQLVHNSAKLLSPDVAARISSVVIFGDPDNGNAVHGVPASNTCIICHAGDVVCDGVPLLDILLLLTLPEHLNYYLDIGAAVKFVVECLGFFA